MKVEAVQVTEFSQRVYDACSAIPEGRVISYGELAKALGCRSAQAIGQALRVNPFAPEVPCHRVVRADGSLGGYHGEVAGEQAQRKIALLASEGVKFDASGALLEPQRMMDSANLVALQRGA